jgi:predicted PurR-regulated permease PerM
MSWVPRPPPSAPDTDAVQVVTPERTLQRRALAFLALAALAAIVRLALPVGVGLFLGALLAFTLQPLYGQLRKRRWRAGPAALVCALGATTIIFVTVAGFTALLVTRGLALLGSVSALLGPGAPLRVLAERATSKLASHRLNAADILEKIQGQAVSLGSRVAAIAAEVAGLTFSALLTLFFMTLAAYFVLRHWNEVTARAELMLPFERRHTHALLDQLRTVGRQVLLGTVVTGLVQGLLAALGYWVTGVPEPAFFGALTALASLIPGVGTLLVWVAIGVVQILTGHAGAGLVQLTYGALVVGVVSDYVIRPRLVGREGGVPAIFTFIALFGGVEVFGMIGLILGPVIVTLSVAILKTYARQVASVSPRT